MKSLKDIVSSNTTGLGHIAINVTDAQLSKKFYQGIGFKYVNSEKLVDSSMVFEYMELHGMVVELQECGDKAELSGVINHFCIDVKGIKELYSALYDGGYNITEINDIPFGKNGVSFFFLTGPDGERIEFSEYK